MKELETIQELAELLDAFDARYQSRYFKVYNSSHKDYMKNYDTSVMNYKQAKDLLLRTLPKNVDMNEFNRLFEKEPALDEYISMDCGVGFIQCSCCSIDPKDLIEFKKNIVSKIEQLVSEFNQTCDNILPKNFKNGYMLVRYRH